MAKLLLKASSRLAKFLGPSGVAFVRHSLGAFERILPHVELGDWKVAERSGTTGATYIDADRRSLALSLLIEIPDGTWHVESSLRRRHSAFGVAADPRTIDDREKSLAAQTVTAIARILSTNDFQDHASMSALGASFDERVVAEHLREHYRLTFDLGPWFTALRKLAEQTYENKALVFGCLISANDTTACEDAASFPVKFLEKKRFRALSDGYRTAYRVSAKGAVRGFVDLEARGVGQKRFFPLWASEIASHSREDRLGLCLTRQGDLIVFAEGQLAFTYRFGRWQYWNHAHITHLIESAARVQKVPVKAVGELTRALYRVALDVSFRRSGALFVLLRNQQNLRKVVRSGDAIGDVRRDAVDRAFDSAISISKVQDWPRAVLAELASLDGAVVINNNGKLLAYGAVLDPKSKKGAARAEGSRSKAAIGASHYGLAIKVSSDGGIVVYNKGKPLVEV